MNMSESINELASALVAAQGEFSAVPKGSVNPFFKSNYAALPEVVATAGPVLAKHGLAISQFIGDDTLTTYLLHASGQFIAQEMKLHLVKNDPQAQGSAVTYARRYSFMSVLGLVADVDDDGNAATQASQAQVSRPAPSSNNLGDRVAQAAGKPSTGGGLATEKMTRMIWAICHKTLMFDDPKMYDTIDGVIGRSVDKLEYLTFEEAKAVIEHLQSLQN
jgi:hypothetical protein